MALPTSTDVLAYLAGFGIDTSIVPASWIDDTITTEIVPKVVAMIDQPLEATTTKTHLHASHNSDVLLLRWKPVQSVVSVKMQNGAAVPFVADLEAGIVRSTSGVFGAGRLWVEVTAQIGLNPLPPAVFRAIVMYAASRVLEYDAETSGGLQSLTVVAHSESFGSEGKFAKQIKSTASSALRLLRPYITGVH